MKKVFASKAILQEIPLTKEVARSYSSDVSSRSSLQGHPPNPVGNILRTGTTLKKEPSVRDVTLSRNVKVPGSAIFMNPATVTAFNVLFKNITNAVNVASVIQSKIDVLQDVPRSQELTDVLLHIKRRLLLVTLLIDYHQDCIKRRTTPIDDLDVDAISRKLEETLLQIEQCKIEDSAIINRARISINEFLSNELELIKALNYENYKSWHWEQLRDIIQVKDFNIRLHCLDDILTNTACDKAVIAKTIQVENTAIKGSYLEETLSNINENLMTLECEVENYSSISLLVYFFRYIPIFYAYI